MRLLARSVMLVPEHGIGGRVDLPVQPWLAMYAGAVAVAVSFCALVMLWRAPRLGAHPVVRLTAVPAAIDGPVVRAVSAGVGVGLLFVFLYVAAVGPNDDGVQNPAPTWLYAWFWVGLVPLSLLLGPVFSSFNPSRGLAAAVRSMLRLRARPMPARIGFLGAQVGLVAFVWLELVFDYSSAPRTVFWFVAVYVAVNTLAGCVYGSAWFAHGDAFEVYSRLIARASAFVRLTDGSMGLQNPLRNLAATPPAPDITPVVLIVLGSTAFDGLSRTSWWSGIVAGSSRSAYLAIGTLGLVASLVIVRVSYEVAVKLTTQLANGLVDARAQFAHALVPIAIGYTVAHYLSFALFQGQEGFLLANDPLGKGWNLFGLAGDSVNYVFITTSLLALLQVGALVVGHVVGVVLAHDRSVALMDPVDSRRGQYPVLLLMIAYTVTGIALLAGS